MLKYWPVIVIALVLIAFFEWRRRYNLRSPAKWVPWLSMHPGSDTSVNPGRSYPPNADINLPGSASEAA